MTSPIDRVLARIAPFHDGSGTFSITPLLTLEEFFDGNDDPGSIWCNLPLGPDAEPHELARTVLEGIRSRPDVADVRVAVADVDQPEWPYASTVLIVTDAAPEEVGSWFSEDTAPDVVDQLDDRSDLEPGMLPDAPVVRCWWD